MVEDFPIQRLENESAKAFEAFVTYAKLGIERTIEKAYLLVTDRKDIENGKRSHLERWSRDFDWKSRARIYDDWLFERQETEKIWLRQRTLAAIADQLEKSLKNDLELAEILSGKLRDFILSDKMSPLIFRNLCGAFKDIAISKAKVLDSYFVATGVDVLEEDFIKKIRDELK